MDLKEPIDSLPFIGPAYEKKFEKLDIKTVGDLLHHVPSRYLDYSKTSKIAGLEIDDVVTIHGKIEFIKNQYTKGARQIQIASVADNTGKIAAVWFNQSFLAKSLFPGEEIWLAGKVGWFGRQKAFISPEHERLVKSQKSIHTKGLIPVYPITAGITPKWLRRRVFEALQKAKPQLKEFFSKKLLHKYDLEDYGWSLSAVHSPKSATEAKRARGRLAFNELFFLHLKAIIKKTKWQKNNSALTLKPQPQTIKKFSASLPFKLTHAQVRVTKEILADLNNKIPMTRILEGDVGSGKTVVAAMAILQAYTNGHQSVIMAPTQILAKQHFDTLKSLLQPFKVELSLVTSATTKQVTDNCDVYVGTHALIHKKINFKNVALVVIDEQHKFGVEQQKHLVGKSGKKGRVPHVLTMTATPIPRTVALTLYGDMDLSLLDEMPKNRPKVVTWLVPNAKRTAAYKWIEGQVLKLGVQAFVVHPLIDESGAETLANVKAATTEYKNLKGALPTMKIGLLHGRQKTEEKAHAIDNFKNGKTNILVSTPVIEVGLDMPNATIMVIEAAERFGLAQLHQLRGRVGRGTKKSYCLLFTQSDSEKVTKRLQSLKKTLSGFELAELDLELRGPGEVFGTRQHGFGKLKIASWTDIALIKASKKMALEITNNSQNYSNLISKFVNQS